MKVLWITNTLFPDVCHELKISVPVVGGWMYSSAEALLKGNQNIKLGVASLYNGDQIRSLEIKGIAYFLIPRSGVKSMKGQSLDPYWKQVRDQFSPDVVHIHGSEYPHGLGYVNACGSENVVVSIQGLVSVYERYYFGGIPERKLCRDRTLRDFIRRDSIFSQRVRMQKRGELERKLINQVNHVIGRTRWDKSHTWAINPTAHYHHCNETLREVFYTKQWELDTCEKYSIFLSQAHYPIKGLHQMIDALPFILKHFPDTKLYIAGSDFVNNKGWRINGYGNLINKLIRKHKLMDKVIFTGILQEKEMCDRYLNSHVFVCPSSIENSPNSVGEAQLLGVPCVASYVGGTMDLIQHEENGLLYRFEEVEMLAEAVSKLFQDKELADRLSKNGRLVAGQRHAQFINSERLNSIYQEICK